jgi:2-polyprenyl-6-methoxyphenol hydroxylase-like FAD-dependent oxidoreductase
MSVPAVRVKSFGGDLDALFEQMMRENAGLRDRFRGATRATPWLAAPLPRFPVRRRWPPRIMPIGNAAAALEPIGGEGIGLAVRSAELAAVALNDSIVEGVPRRFDSLWSVRRAACRAVAKLLACPAIARDMIEFSSGNERLATAVMGWLGKG